MKYMLWRDLEPGDALQFTDEYLFRRNSDFNWRYRDENLIIYNIEFHTNHITVCFSPDSYQWPIKYDGTSLFNRKVAAFKLIKLKDEQ